MRRWIGAVGLLATVALPAVACGDDDGGSVDTTTGATTNAARRSGAAGFPEAEPNFEDDVIWNDNVEGLDFSLESIVFFDKAYTTH